MTDPATDMSLDAMQPGTGDPPGTRHREPKLYTLTWRVAPLPLATAAGNPSFPVLDVNGHLRAVCATRADAERVVMLNNADVLGGR
jgi:hypothetical protein